MHIRMVPKARNGSSRPRLLTAFARTSVTKTDPEAARQTQRICQELGMDATLTKDSGVNVSVDHEHARDIFGMELVEQHFHEHSERDRQSVMTVRRGEEVKVPEALMDIVDFAYVPSPPLFFDATPIPPNSALYHLRLSDVAASLRAPLCHRDGVRGSGIRVAMTDSGFARHPFFERGNYMITRVSSSPATDPEIDTSGHGTGECANIFAVAPECHVIGVKQENRAAEALETALQQNPHVVTNSWGFDMDTQSSDALQGTDPNLFNEFRDLDRIIAEAVDDGVVMIFSAGNGHYAFPGSHPDAISAGGALVQEDGVPIASDYASSFASALFQGRMVPDICGIVGSRTASGTQGFLPGHIMLPVPVGADLDGENLGVRNRRRGWGIFSGTSAAAPQLAGVVALMLGRNPDLSPKAIKQILRDTAIDVVGGSSAMGDRAVRGNDLATGGGLTDAWAACEMAERMV